MKADNPDEAIEEFLGLPAMEEEKGDWYRSPTCRFLWLTDTVTQGL